MEEVPESERRVPCMSENEALRLAKLGVTQEELWGAGRDIEWAICKVRNSHIHSITPVSPKKVGRAQETLHWWSEGCSMFVDLEKKTKEKCFRISHLGRQYMKLHGSCALLCCTTMLCSVNHALQTHSFIYY